jgi:glycosyltransferase involved in cell wall biosynthesis
MEQSLKPNDRIRVCWIANLKPLKQPELFVQLANEFKEEQALEFVMIGRSEKQYDALIRDTEKMLPNFNYLGELSNDEVNKVLEESHILVNTSQYEGFSNTFIQAWMRKVAVISLNSNPDGLLSTGEIGFLAESMENMAAILKRMVKHPELVVEVGEKAYRHAMEFHSYAKNVEVLTKLMKIDE